jgi:hypothetical protein
VGKRVTEKEDSILKGIFKQSSLFSFLPQNFFNILWEIIACLLFIIITFILFVTWLVGVLGSINV